MEQREISRISPSRDVSDVLRHTTGTEQLMNLYRETLIFSAVSIEKKESQENQQH